MRVTKQSIAKMLCNIHEHVCGVKKVANGIRANCAVDSVDMRLTSTLASMGWLWVAWALLAVAPAPLEPEARNGFPSGNISTIPDFPVTLDGLSRVVFRLDETSSSNCAPRVEGFHFSPPPAAATAAPTAHGLRDVCHTLPDATRTTSASAFVDFDLCAPFCSFSPFLGHCHGQPRA